MALRAPHAGSPCTPSPYMMRPVRVPAPAPALALALVYSLLWLPPARGTPVWNDADRRRSVSASSSIVVGIGTRSGHPVGTAAPVAATARGYGGTRNHDRQQFKNETARRRKHRRRTTAHDTGGMAEDVVFEASIAGQGVPKKAKASKAPSSSSSSPSPTAMTTTTTTAPSPAAAIPRPILQQQPLPTQATSKRPRISTTGAPARPPPPQPADQVVVKDQQYRTIQRGGGDGGGGAPFNETTSFCETQLPVAASAVVDMVLYFRYTLTLPEDFATDDASSHESQLPAIEERIHQELATHFLADCLFYDETSFSVLSLSTAPPDQIVPIHDASISLCGPNCRHVSAGISMATFYILYGNRRSRPQQAQQQPPRRGRTNRQLMDDPIVAESFGNELRWILARLSADQSTVWKMEFVSLAPMAVNDETPVFEDRDSNNNNNQAGPTSSPPPPNVAASIQQSSPRQPTNRAALSWGTSFLALAALTLFVVSIMSIQHRHRRQQQQSDDRAGLHETYVNDQDRYTYDGGDGVQYMVNDDLMVDTEEGIEAVNRPWTTNVDLHVDATIPSSCRPPKYVQVQRAYESPDTVDL